MTEEVATKTKAPKSKKSGPDRSTKIATTFKRKVAGLERHLKLHPGDAAAQTALSKLEKKGTVTPRKAPNSEKWTHVTKDLAQMHRAVGYRGHGVLRFGQQGVGVFEGMRESTKLQHEVSVKKYFNKLKQAAELKEAQKEKEKNERLAKESAQRRRVEEEKKKLKGKTAKKPSASKTPAKPAKPKPTAKQ